MSKAFVLLDKPESAVEWETQFIADVASRVSAKAYICNVQTFQGIEDLIPSHDGQTLVVYEFPETADMKALEEGFRATGDSIPKGTRITTRVGEQLRLSTSTDNYAEGMSSFLVRGARIDTYQIKPGLRASF